MANQQLITYIKTQVANGAVMEAIRTALLGAGWAEADVNEAIAAVAPPAQTPAAAQPIVPVAAVKPVVETVKQVVPAEPQMMASPATQVSAAARPQVATQPVTVNLTGATSASPSFKVDEVVFHPEFAGASSFDAPTTMAQMAPTVVSGKKTGGSRIWFFVAIIFILFALAGGVVAGFFYTENSDLQGRVTSLSAQNARLADQSGVTVKDRKTTDDKVAALTDVNTDLESQLAIFVLPTGSAPVVDRSLTIRGKLESVPAGYTLTTSRGIVLQVKNSKDPRIDALLKPFVGTTVTMDGVVTPGVREITFIGFSAKDQKTNAATSTTPTATSTPIVPSTVKVSTSTATTTPVQPVVPVKPTSSSTPATTTAPIN